MPEINLTSHAPFITFYSSGNMHFASNCFAVGGHSRWFEETATKALFRHNIQYVAIENISEREKPRENLEFNAQD